MTSLARTPARRLAADDERLMLLVQRRDIDALGELYDRFCDRAYRVAWSVCRDADRAEDAVQDAFVAIWRSSATTYQPQGGAIAAWLLTVVRRRAIDIARHDARHTGKRHDADRLHAHAARDDITAEVTDRADDAHLHALLAELPDAQREVITLAFYDQLKHTEIAARLDLPPETVKGRMRLGLHKLRDRLPPDPLNPPTADAGSQRP